MTKGMHRTSAVEFEDTDDNEDADDTPRVGATSCYVGSRGVGRGGASGLLGSRQTPTTPRRC